MKLTVLRNIVSEKNRWGKEYYRSVIEILMAKKLNALNMHKLVLYFT